MARKPIKSAGGMLQWLGLALVILMADQFTKVLIVGTYQLGDSTDSSDFGQCLKSKQKRSYFRHFFLSEIRTLKNPTGKLSLDFRQKKSV